MSSKKRNPPSSPSVPVSRRTVLQGLGATIATVGCGGTGTTATTTTGGTSGAGGGGSTSSSGTGGAGGGGSTSSTTTSSSSGTGGTGGQGADACTSTSALTAAELLAPIDTIVVLCMENRSFDHYLGSLSMLEGRAVDGLTGAETNPDPNGVPIPVFKLNNFTVSDPPHGWDPVHEQWNEGKNDGFVTAHAGVHQQEVMGYHVRDQIPVTYALADASVVCDRYFASVLGPTWPNRFYLHGATSEGNKSNLPAFGFTSIFDRLDDAGVSHKNYFSDIPWCSGAYFKVSGLASIDQFFADAEAGQLPAFTLIDPNFFGSNANDDHPNHDVRLGQAFIATVFTALAKSPHWNRCLFVLTYDEHGGFFDHVPPPPVIDDDPEFDHLGFRVPTLVAGPFVRRGCTVSTTFEHSSVPRTLAVRFGLQSLNARMDAANDFSVCLDPATFEKPQAPPTLPQVTVPMNKVREARETRISQPELWEIAENGGIPKHLDRRADSLALTECWLRHGERLGAVRIV